MTRAVVSRALGTRKIVSRPAPALRRPTTGLFTPDQGLAFGATELNPSAVASLTAALPLGARWLRIVVNGMDWAAYGASSYDSLVNTALALGYQIQIQLAFVPLSNSTAPANVQQSSPATASHYVPADYTVWSSWVTTVATRFKGKVLHWECWNEPDGGFWLPTNTDTASFAHLQAVTYQALKAVDPRNQVMLGSLAGGGTGYNQNFFPNVWGDATYPAVSYCDLIGLHFYDYTRLPTLTSALRSWMGANRKPIWSNEFGASSNGGVAAQRSWISAAIATAKANGISKLFYFQVWDTGVDPNNYGLLDANLKVKQ